MRASRFKERATSAMAVYVIMLVVFQLFLLSVMIEAFQSGNTSLAWSTATVSVISAILSGTVYWFLQP